MNRSLLYAAGLLVLAGCAQSDKPHYTVTYNAEGEDNNGKTVYIVDFDTDEKLDSATIENGVAVFSNDIDSARFVSIVIDERGVSQFFLEGDSINIVDGAASGGALNAKNEAYWTMRMDAIKEFRNLPDSVKEARYAEFEEKINGAEQALMNENIDNALGFYYFFYGPAREMNLQQLDSAIAAHPSLGNYQRIQKMRQAFMNQAETSEGKMFKDFEVTYNDSTFRLSDHVGKGKYVLVDFWASWCGPCIRQTKVIKELYKEYGPKGLEVIGVAVWDKPEDTLKGIESHELPWMNVINAQNIPTDIYGIQGIPCIILFGPDGKILSRDKQDDALRNDVAAAMKEAK